MLGTPSVFNDLHSGQHAGQNARSGLSTKCAPSSSFPQVKHLANRCRIGTQSAFRLMVGPRHPPDPPRRNLRQQAAKRKASRAPAPPPTRAQPNVAGLSSRLVGHRVAPARRRDRTHHMDTGEHRQPHDRVSRPRVRTQRTANCRRLEVSFARPCEGWDRVPHELVGPRVRIQVKLRPADILWICQHVESALPVLFDAVQNAFVPFVPFQPVGQVPAAVATVKSRKSVHCICPFKSLFLLMPSSPSRCRLASSASISSRIA